VLKCKSYFLTTAPWFILRWSAARGGAQYLALAPLPSLDHRTTFHGSPPSPSCIQFWSISPTTNPDKGDESHDMEVSCQIVACIDDGPVRDIKWTRLPSHDDPCTQNSSYFRSCVTILYAQQAKVSGSSAFWPPLLNQGTSVYTSSPIRVTSDDPTCRRQLESLFSVSHTYIALIYSSCDAIFPKSTYPLRYE